MALNGKEVLIIDDSPEVRMLFRKILVNVGMVVDEAGSVADAFKILDKKIPQLILLDLIMPEVGGISFLEKRATHPLLAAVPVIVISVSKDIPSVHRVLALGVSDYILKPVAATTLIQKIRKALKDTEFESYKFPENAQPVITCPVPVQISRISEEGFFLESIIKINPKTTLAIESDELKQMGLENCVFITSHNPVTNAPQGRYVCRVRVAGLRQSITQVARKAGFK